METILKELSAWFKERPKWLQEAARRLYTKGQITSEDLIELSSLCESEPLGKIDGNDCDFFDDASTGISHRLVRLSSIDCVTGINALQPKKALDFGGSNLAIVFGSNGSGKSGYVRIVKHICGVKAPGKLYPNVFFPAATIGKCKVSYEVDGQAIEKEWIVDSGPIKELRIVDVFDSRCARFYITEENEVTYEPPLLSFFSELAKICERVAVNIESSETRLVSKKPLMPAEYAATQIHKWYSEIKADLDNRDLEHRCSWSDSDENSLNDLAARLLEQNPAEKAKRLLTQKKHIDLLLQDIEEKLRCLSDEQCKKIMDLKDDFIQKRKIAKEVADRAFHDSKMNGIGGEVWQLLWKHARQYSETHAYPGLPFPHLEDGALCVLCQQELSEDGKIRLRSFEEYIKDEVSKEATKSETAYTTAIEAIGKIPVDSDLKTRLDAAGLDGQDMVDEARNLFEALRNRAARLPHTERTEELVPIPESAEFRKRLLAVSEKLGVDALKYQQDATGNEQSKLKADCLELQARKWLYQQKPAIEEEVGRLKKISQLSMAKKLTNTAILSRKKGELAEKLITDAFVQRFVENLSVLGASKIRVELVKTRTDKGKVLHQLKLKGAPNVPVEEILSEGEYRVVSLALFLADVEGGATPVPFVFDDPITSLDQAYEEAVVELLVRVAQKRQVIVFTHRVSLLVMLQDHGQKNDMPHSVICLKRENWGAGEPGGTPLFAQKPDKALKYLLNERLAQAKRTLEEKGQDEYDPLAKALCGEFRIILERMIERELLADVVQRYRRSIQTLNKIGKLARINESDCKLFDALMTKYSRYEHSQPDEAPVQMPLPDEMKVDFEKLETWHGSFSQR